MPFLLQPRHILLATISGLVNQRQQRIIEFQNAQIEALLKRLVGKRLFLDDDQRRILAVKAHALTRVCSGSVPPGQSLVQRWLAARLPSTGLLGDLSRKVRS